MADTRWLLDRPVLLGRGFSVGVWRLRSRDGGYRDDLNENTCTKVWVSLQGIHCGLM
jgi:hypothetical protein